MKNKTVNITPILNKIISLFLLLFLIISIPYSICYANSDPYPKNQKIDVLNYIFNITLSDEKDEILCEEIIDLRFKENGIKKIRLDLVNASNESNGKGMKVIDLLSNNKKLKFIHENNNLYIFLNTASKKNDRVQFKITYRGIPQEGLYIGNNKYGDRTFFSDNWPNRARHWLALIDHPSDKAKCEFVVTAPDHYQVISNGLKIEETHLNGNKLLTHWKQSVPIAPWLYVLGVAEFAIQYFDEFKGKSLQTWVFKQDRDAGFYDYSNPTKNALEFYENNIGPFSYEKLANVQSNSVSGGMEAASAILYSDKSVVGDRNERWRNVIIHEIAHQWFGNSVTEFSWDDIWLSEGFATYFTLLFIEHEYGRDEFIKGLKSSKKTVDSFHKKYPNYTVVHNDLKDMKDVTSVQTYQKGSWILHMLRGLLGTKIFWKGIRAYYLKYKDLNASTKDFKTIMEEVSGKDLTKFFDQWLYKPGNLVLDGVWKYDKNLQEITLELKQVQKGNVIIEMPIEIGIDYGENEYKIEKINLKQLNRLYKIKADKEPLNVIIDPNMWVLKNHTLKKIKSS